MGFRQGHYLLTQFFQWLRRDLAYDYQLECITLARPEPFIQSDLDPRCYGVDGLPSWKINFHDLLLKRLTNLYLYKVLLDANTEYVYAWLSLATSLDPLPIVPSSESCGRI